MTAIIIQENRPQNLESKKDLVKRLYCKNSTDDELELFMQACKKTGLDPFMKQIYAIKRGASLTIQTGIDGLRLIAERTGNYSPGKESTYSYDDKGKLVSATSYIKKRTSDNTWHEVAASAYMDEYNAGQGLWTKMPRAMLSKCAEAIALRKAFPAEMSGLYTSDEMSQADKHEEISEPLTEEQCAELDTYLMQISDKEYLEQLDKYLTNTMKVNSIYEIKGRDYKKVIASLEKKVKTKVVEDGSQSVA